MDLIDARRILGMLTAGAAEDTGRVWREATQQNWSPAEFVEFITEAFPELVLPHAATAADVAVAVYDATPTTTRGFVAVEGPLAPTERLQTSAAWALNARAGQEALEALAAIAERAIFDGFRDTITANADREPGARWARHASANACGWCRMLATREAVYTSAHAAGDGNRYHDHCHCMAVVVRPGQTYTPPPYVAQWDDDYKEARKISTDPAVIARLMTSPQ